MRPKYKPEGLGKIRRETNQLVRKMGMTTKDFSDYMAFVVRRTVVRNAQPFGLGGKAFRVGKKAIRKDLLKVFKLVPESARGKSGVVDSYAEAKRIHESRRARDGRTRRGQQYRILQSVFEMYVSRTAERVGRAKGSLVGGEPARLGGRFQKWISRHKKEGDASVEEKAMGSVWTFEAFPKHVASNRVFGKRGVNRVLSNKDKNLRNALKRKLKADLRKAQKRVNS